MFANKTRTLDLNTITTGVALPGQMRCYIGVAEVRETFWTAYAQPLGPGFAPGTSAAGLIAPPISGRHRRVLPGLEQRLDGILARCSSCF